MADRAALGEAGSAASPSVAVLLATFNGEAFLEELLDSLAAQRYQNLRVYVRDDGSTDGSGRLIEQFHGLPVTIVRDDLGRLGAAHSFLRLLRVARAEVYMFCDQDDVWLPGKVENAVKAILARGVSKPVLYHTDLVLVDERLRVIHDSFHRHEGLRMPQAQAFGRLVVQNCVVGCTVAVTEALVAQSGVREVEPAGMAMHDWWLALWSACFGDLVYAEQGEILYRQHAGNVSGSRGTDLMAKVRRQFSRSGVDRILGYVRKVARQAEGFAGVYGARLPPGALGDLRAVGALSQGSGLWGAWSCAVRGIRLQVAYMNVAILFSLVAWALTSRSPER